MTAKKLTLAECGERNFTTVARGVCYRYEASGVGLTFTFDRLRRPSTDELHCELTVSCALDGSQALADGVISQAAFNVSSDRARADRAKRITIIAMLSEVPVDRLLEDACVRVLNAERSAVAAMSLHDVDEPEDSQRFVIHGIQLDLSAINMFYGLPGSGKTLESGIVALELSRSGRRVGYVDFEWEPGQHRVRARKLYGPQFPDVRYVRLERPLVTEIDGLRRTVLLDGWDFAVLDSVSFGCAGAPESAEVAAEFIQACRQLRIPLLLVGHQTKGEGGDRFPFGSIMWFAGAREIYHFRRSNSEDSPDRLITAVTHRKSNAGGLRGPSAIEYTFTPDRIVPATVNPATVADIAPELSVKVRLRHALTGGPRAITDLTDELGVDANAIRQALKRDVDAAKRNPERATFLRVADGRIGLVDHARTA